MDATAHSSGATAGALAVRVAHRAVRMIVLSPWTWMLAAVAIGLALVTNVRLVQAPLALAASSRDAADQYVQALQTGNVDDFLASLSPGRRTELSNSGAGRAADAEQHVAEQSAQRAPLERQLVQDREDFLDLVAHELKTPVAVIKAYAELLEAQMAKQELAQATRAHTIRVELGRGEHDGRPMAMLSVRDEGIGLEPADLDRIFDRFVQATGGPVRGHAGLGLGLYVARQIARAHGGDVWAESPGKGRGSTFHLRLPLGGVMID